MEVCGCLLGHNHLIPPEWQSLFKIAFSRQAQKQICRNWGKCSAISWCAKRLLGVLRIISLPCRLDIAAQALLWVWSRTSVYCCFPPVKCRWFPYLSKEFSYAPLSVKYLASNGQRKVNSAPFSLQAGGKMPFRLDVGCFEGQSYKRPTFQNCRWFVGRQIGDFSELGPEWSCEANRSYWFQGFLRPDPKSCTWVP